MRAEDRNYSNEIGLIVSRIVESVDPAAIYLLDSFAYSLPIEKSDFDFNIVLPDMHSMRPIQVIH